MIIDRRRSVGEPARCAGYVPSWLLPRAGLDDSSVVQQVDGIRLVAEDGAVTEHRVGGLVLDRTRFDKTLAIHALEAGADLCNGFVLARRGDSVVARRNGIEAPFRGHAVVGADGPASVIGQSFGRRTVRFAATLQYEVGLASEERWVEYRQPLFDGRGVGWVVPSGRTAKVGVSLPRRDAGDLKRTMRRMMAILEADRRIHRDAVLGATGGLVPLTRGPWARTDGQALLAGDAAGTGAVFAGAGIAAAYLCGELAGEACYASISEDDGCVLYDYERSIDRRTPVLPADGAERLDAMQAYLKAWANESDAASTEPD